jgi:hypothetical protein
MAHAVAGNFAFILATSPATHRALTGQESLPAARSGSGPSGREAAASQLLDALANANRLAAGWLAALRAAGEGQDAERSDVIEFNEAETALALYVLDDRSIRDLLSVLNLMIESARRLGPSPSDNGQAGSG